VITLLKHASFTYTAGGGFGTAGVQHQQPFFAKPVVHQLLVPLHVYHFHVPDNVIEKKKRAIVVVMSVTQEQDEKTLQGSMQHPKLSEHVFV
jgi:hypothetical protein